MHTDPTVAGRGGRGRSPVLRRAAAAVRAAALVGVWAVSAQPAAAQNPGAAPPAEAAASVAVPQAQPVQDIAFLEQVAASLHAAGQSREALDPAREALRLRQAQQPPDPVALARAWANLGEIQRDLQQWAAAAHAQQRALALRVQAHGPRHPDVARSGHALGVLDESQGQPRRALSRYRRAEALLAEVEPEGLLRARVLRDLAALELRVGAPTRASAQLAQALAIHRARADGSARSNDALATVLLDQAELAQRQRQDTQAGALFAEALALQRQAPKPRPLGLASALLGAATWQRQQGQWSLALAQTQEALDGLLRARGPEHPDVAGARHQLGELLYAAGDLPGAEREARAALAIRRERLPAGHADTALSLNNLALVLLDTGRADEAVPLLDEALTRWRRQPAGTDRTERLAASLHNLGAARMQQGRPAEARQAFERSLAAWRAEDAAAWGDHRRAQAVTRNQLAEALDHLGETALAAPLHRRAAAALWADGAAPLELAMALSRLAEHHARVGETAAAIFHGKQAVNVLQTLRADLAGGSEALGRSFLASREPIYQRLAARLIDAGRLAEAQQVLAMLKHDELRQFQRGADTGSTETPLALNGRETRGDEDWNALAEAQRSLNTEARELDAASRSPAGLSEAQRERRRALNRLRAAAVQQFERFMVDTHRRLAAGGTGEEAPNAQALEQLAHLQGALREAGDGTVLVHYAMLEDELRIVVTSADSIVPRTVAVPRLQLNRTVARLREQIRLRDPAVRDTARQLHAWLVAPIQAELDAAGARTVLLSKVGALRYLPFAALHDGKQWLVERYALAVYTPAAAAAAFTPGGGRWRAAGFGLSKAVSGFDALPSVRGELAAVIGPQGVPGSSWIDDDFTRDRVDDALLDEPTVLHLATHVVFKPGTERESFLLLGDGNRLTLAELRGLQFKGLELLTLSACETALGGGVNENGREIEGFAAAAQRRGAAAVMASLWPVADDSTARLMQAFYRARQASGGTTKAEALRAAQRALIAIGAAATPAAASAAAAATEPGPDAGTERGARTAGAQMTAGGPEVSWSHPYYWAAFVLIGNWR